MLNNFLIQREYEKNSRDVYHLNNRSSSYLNRI